MNSRRNGAALVVAVIGLALMIVESAQTLRGKTLGTVGAIVLYVGLGLFVIAGAVLLTDHGSEPAPVESRDDHDAS